MPHTEGGELKLFGICDYDITRACKVWGNGLDSFLDVQIVMMLANADTAEQVKTLRKMVDIFDEVNSLFAIMEAESPTDIANIMKENFQEG